MADNSELLDLIEAVYRERGSDFFRFALARTGDVELARDAVQEGFARAIKARRGFRGAGPLQAWIGRCVLNATADANRNRSRDADGSDVVPAELVSSFWAENADGDVRRAIGQLPARQRDALFLRFYLDFDYAEIAAALGIAVGTVSATLHAARENLGTALQEVTP